MVLEREMDISKLTDEEIKILYIMFQRADNIALWDDIESFFMELPDDYAFEYIEKTYNALHKRLYGKDKFDWLGAFDLGRNAKNEERLYN